MLNRKVSSEEAERLLAGKTPADEDVARLSPLVDSLRRSARRAPAEDAVARVAAEAAFAASDAASSEGSTIEKTAGPRRRQTRWVPKLVGAMVVLVALSSTAGVAVAANGAAPGDTLYGFDRALERVGLGDGGLHERLQEAQTLAERDQVDEALAHATSSLAAADDAVPAAAQAYGALLQVEATIQTASNDELDHARLQISEMLAWMASADTNEADFGREVSEIAQDIARGQAAGHSSPDTTLGGPSSGDTGGPSDSQGTQQENSQGSQGPSSGSTTTATTGTVGPQSTSDGDTSGSDSSAPPQTGSPGDQPSTAQSGSSQGGSGQGAHASGSTGNATRP